MRNLSIICFFLVAGSCFSYAQSGYAPPIQPIIKTNTGMHNDVRIHFPAFTVVNTNHHGYTLSEQNRHSINGDWITSAKIMHDSTSKRKYGIAAKNGITLITIDDKDHPEAYKFLKAKMKLIKRRKAF